MNEKKYLLISGILFLVLAVLHLLRVIFSWPFEIGEYSIPIWVSYFPVVILGVLSRWAFRLYATKG